MHLAFPTTMMVLLTLVSGSPVPESGLTDKTAVVSIPPSTSYSSLIMANPSPLSSTSTSTRTGGAEAYITPSNIDLPIPSATFNMDGNNLPSLAAAPSRLGTSESAGVKLVGQDSSTGTTSTSNSNTTDDASVIREDTKQQEEESKSNSGGSGITIPGIMMGCMGLGLGLAMFGNML